MKIIAFSGNSNTGKTTAIHFLRDFLLARNPEVRIQLFQESAREYILAHGGGGIDNMHDFERYIFQCETKRIAELIEAKEKQSYDYAFIDRTTLDCFIYSYRNLVHGDLEVIDYTHGSTALLAQSKEVYDHVVFFTTPIKKDSRFDIYNNDHINAIFEHSIHSLYKEKVITYTNNMFFQDNLESTVLGDIGNLI
jgi:hypothetical protein